MSQRPDSRSPATSRGHILDAAKGGMFLAGGGFFEFVGRFGIAWLLARAIGAAEYGLYTLGVSTAALVVGLTSLGLDDAMVRYVAIQSGKRDMAGLRGTIQTGVIGTVASGTVGGAVLFLLAEPLSLGLFDEPGLVPLLRFFAVLIPFLTLSAALLGIARGFNRMDVATLGENVVQTIVRLVLILVFSLFHLDAFTAAVIFGVSDLAASMVMVIALRRLRLMPGRSADPPRRDLREIFGFALPLWISGSLNRFRRNIETFVLGALSIAADVGIFAIAGRVTAISHMVYRAVIVSVKPLLARAFASSDRGTLADLYASTTRWTLTMSLPFFLGMVLYPSAILSVFGEDFVDGAPALAILAFSELAVAATGTCGSMIDMAGHTRVKVANSVFWVAIVLVTSILLIPRFGVVGAALSSTISTTSVNLLRLAEVWFLDRLQPYRRDLWKVLVAAGLALATGLSLDAVAPHGDRLGMSILQASAVVVVYLASLSAFGLHPDDRLVFRKVAERFLPKRLFGRNSSR